METYLDICTVLVVRLTTNAQHVEKDARNAGRSVNCVLSPTFNSLDSDDALQRKTYIWDERARTAKRSIARGGRMSARRQAATSSYGPDDEHAAAMEAARAIQYIEANLFGELNVDVIANVCATSPFHFSRRFRRRQGESVMAYVRGRRLDVAAKRLRDEPVASVVQLALECRFDSHAAFSRAFARAFGVSPSAYRRSSGSYVRRRRQAMTPDLHESIEFVDTFRVAGLSGRYDPSSYVRIAELWKAFVAKANFPGRLGEGETCGVFRERDFAAQSFEHLAGARIAAGFEPEGLDVWALPGRHYLVFKHFLIDGELHPQVAAAQAEIWGKRVARSGRTLARAADFQIYPAGFKVGKGGWLAYYLPIE
jgi:AraC family transcriptional regulator